MNRALTMELPKNSALNVDSEDDYDYGLYPSDSPEAFESQWTSDDIEGMDVVEAEQCEDEVGRSSLPRLLQVEEVSVVPKPGVTSDQNVCSATAAHVEDWSNLPGPSGVQQRREFDTCSNYSDDSDHEDSDHIDNEIFEGDEELQIPDVKEDDYNIFVTDSSKPSENEAFEWHDMTKFTARREAFAETAGPTRLLVDPYLAFTAIWDQTIMEEIVTETNRYFVQKMEKEVRAEHSRTKYWKDTTVHEMYTFLAVILLMGIVKMPSIESYFSVNYLLQHPALGYIMSKQRYRLLSEFLHFVNNDDLKTFKGNNKLFKMQSIIDHCNRKFKELYIPSQNIAIDESLTLWKGQLSWKQYLVSKSAKFGIKTFELCESATGYLWSFTVYTGQNTASTVSTIVPKGALKSTEIVLSLIEPLLNKGYTVWMNNLFNSPSLARFLKNRNTDCAGTLRVDQKDVPKDMKTRKLEQGRMLSLSSDFCAVFSWLDKRKVSLISTFHTDKMVTVRRKGQPVVTKPDIIKDYNLFMGGIDKKEQMLQPYLVERKRDKKWYVNFFKRLLNVSVFNAKILYEASVKSKIRHLEFKLKLIDSIIRQHLHLARPDGPPLLRQYIFSRQ